MFVNFVRGGPPYCRFYNNFALILQSTIRPKIYNLLLRSLFSIYFKTTNLRCLCGRKMHILVSPQSPRYFLSQVFPLLVESSQHFQTDQTSRHYPRVYQHQHLLIFNYNFRYLMLRAVLVVWPDYSYLPRETVATTQIIFFSSDSRGNWRSWSISAFLSSLLWLWKNATRLCLASKPLSSFSRCRNMADPLLIPENQMILGKEIIFKGVM